MMVMRQDYLQWFSSFLIKKSSGSGVAVIEPNYHLSNELHRQIIRKFKDEKFIHPLETIFGC